MRVEEYERHFMKMMQYAPDDTNTDQKKQFWFLRGLQHGLRQALKASEHKSLHHLVNRAIAVEDERRGHEERMKGKKRMGDRDQPDRSFHKPRSGQSNMLRGSYRPGHNQPGRGFGGGGRSPFPGGRNPGYPQQTGGYTRAPPSTARPTAGGFTVTCFACGKPQVLRVPRQEDRCHPREGTCSKRPTSLGRATASCRSWEAEPPY
jgi:hypothetical protein